MTNIFLNLSGKIENPVVDALQILKKVADSLGVNFFVVGSSARDFILRHQHGIDPRRKTGDIDLEVEVANWDQFKTLFDSLISTGQFFRTSERQRLRCGIVLIDILPFGPIADEEKKISWPPEHEIIMSMAGFEEAYEHSITARVTRYLMDRFNKTIQVKPQQHYHQEQFEIYGRQERGEKEGGRRGGGQRRDAVAEEQPHERG